MRMVMLITSVVLVVFFVREELATRGCQKPKILNVIFGRVRLRGALPGAPPFKLVHFFSSLSSHDQLRLKPLGLAPPSFVKTSSTTLHTCRSSDPLKGAALDARPVAGLRC